MSASSFKPFKKGNPCPVCANDKGDCRYSTQDADFIQCHSYADARKLETINGYTCVKEASGHTASFKRLNSDNFLEDSQRLLEQRREREKQNKRQKEALIKGLSVEQRDKATRTLSKHLGLSTKHRENLQNRGLTDKEIDAGCFFSVAPGEELPFGIPANYPGATNGRLTVGAKGFACPIWSIDGLIIGWQLRADDVVNNKYRWAKGNFSSHLPNGELPITIVRPSVVKHDWVADIEGVLKPYVAAQTLGAVCIGAAGGNVVGSPEQFKEAIAKLDCKEIRDFPDAGDVWNRNVMQRRIAKYEFYRSLGLDVKIGWWGQVTRKQDRDIDELPNLDVVEYISVEQFLETARWHGGLDALSKVSPQQPKLTPLEREELREEYLDRCDRNEEFLRSFQAAAAKIKSLIFGTPKNSKHFVSALPAEVAPEVNKVVATVEYVPGELPTHDQHEEILKAGLSPVYECRPSLHSVLWQEAVAKGWKHILDSSPTGSGKSHQAGLANPSDYQSTKQLWYFAADHRNPTTKTVETGYIDLVTRNDGMKSDDTRKTPSGKNFIVRAKIDEDKDVAGNCEREPMFRAYADKNIKDIELSSGNPICEGCRHFKAFTEDSEGKKVPKCLAESGDGFGFRGQRRDILASSKIRAHPTSAPQPKEESIFEGNEQLNLLEEQHCSSSNDGYDYSKSGAFWDEASTLINVSKNIEVRQPDFTKAFYEMRVKLPEFNEVLEPLWHTLGRLIDPNHPNYIDRRSHYGMSDTEIRNLLPEVPENIDFIIARARIALEPDLRFLVQTDAVTEKTKRLSDVLLNWFVPFLEAWKDGSGYFQCDYGTVLKITIRDLHHVEVAKALKFNIYLDATHSPDLLALELDVARSEILNIRTPLPDHSNLQIHQVVGMGRMSKNRSTNLKERTAAIKSELQNRHSNKLGILDWKACAEGQEGYHFRDGRGVNHYKDCEALAVFGVPYSNIGSLAARYRLLTGKSVDLESKTRNPNFQAFINHYVNSEIIQELGRLRTHLRSGQKLDFYFVADYDISWLKNFCSGASINQIDAFTLNHSAGSKVQKVRLAIMEAVMKLRDRLGKNPTQEQVAAESGIKRGNIGRIAAQFGGWEAVLKLFTFLYKSLYSKMNNLENPPNDDLAFMAKQYLPLLVAEHRDDPSKLCEELLTVQTVHGPSGIASIFKAATFEVKMQIFTIFTQLLPDWMKEQFLEGLPDDKQEEFLNLMPIEEAIA